MKRILFLSLLLFFSYELMEVDAATYDANKDYFESVGGPDYANYSWLGTNKTGFKQPQTSVSFGLVHRLDVSGFTVRGGGTETRAYLRFYDGDNKLLYSHQFGNESGGKSGTFSVNINGVEKIHVDVNRPGPNGLNMEKLELYGTTAGKTYYPVLDLENSKTFNSIDLNWKNPDSDEIDSIIIKSNGIEVATLANSTEVYSLSNLTPETTYNVEVIVKYTDGGLSLAEKITVKTDAKPDDVNPPGEISNLAFGVSSTGVAFSWFNPPDTDFSHVRIYQDNLLIEGNHTQNEYQVTGLTPNTTYVFKFVTVDKSGNNSMGYIQTVKTDPEVDNVAPAAPSGINVSNGSGSGTIRWQKNSELDVLGYNVYVDGNKHNSSVILSTTYVVSNLTNDQTYDISVSAVDTSFNESLLSDSVPLTPFAGGMPVFDTSYDLQLVADGTGSWFNAFWPILAFAVGIPLAFYVSNRVKTLFFA